MKPRVARSAFVAYAIFLVVYSAIIGIGYQSTAVAAWMHLFQPSVDLLSPFLPSLQQMPLHLSEQGNDDWVLPAQHILLVGWSLLLPVLLLFIIDIFVIYWSYWSKMHLFLSKNTLAIFVPLWIFIIFLFGFDLISGAFVPVSKRRITLLLLVLPFLFVIVAGMLFVLMISCVALVQKLYPMQPGAPSPPGTT